MHWTKKWTVHYLLLFLWWLQYFWLHLDLNFLNYSLKKSNWMWSAWTEWCTLRESTCWSNILKSKRIMSIVSKEPFSEVDNMHLKEPWGNPPGGRRIPPVVGNVGPASSGGRPLPCNQNIFCTKWKGQI